MKPPVTIKQFIKVLLAVRFPDVLRLFVQGFLKIVPGSTQKVKI